MSPHGQDPLRHPIAGRRRHHAAEQRLHTKPPPAHAPARSKNPSRHSVHKPPSHTTAGRKQHRVDRALRATQSRQRQTQTATNHPRLKIIVGRKESKPDRERTRGCCVLELAWTSSKTRLLNLDDVSKISLLFPRESDDCLGVSKIVSFYYWIKLYEKC